MRERYIEDLTTHCTNLKDSFRELDGYIDLKQDNFIRDYAEVCEEVLVYLPDMRQELLGKRRYLALLLRSNQLFLTIIFITLCVFDSFCNELLLNK